MLSQHNVQWDQIFTQTIERQLPHSLNERWIRKLSSLIEADVAPTSEAMMDFLSAELVTRETMATTNNSFDTVKSKSKQQGPRVSKNSAEESKQGF